MPGTCLVFLLQRLTTIVKPLPLGALITLSISVSCLTRVFSIENALAAYGANCLADSLCIFIAQALTQTGLGQRISYHILSVFGAVLWDCLIVLF